MTTDVLFLIAAAAAFIMTVLYYRSESRGIKLEQQLGEKLIEEYERRHRAEVDESFANLSDAEQFTRAVSRGIDEVPELPRDKSRKQ